MAHNVFDQHPIRRILTVGLISAALGIHSGCGENMEKKSPSPSSSKPAPASDDGSSSKEDGSASK